MKIPHFFQDRAASPISSPRLIPEWIVLLLLLIVIRPHVVALAGAAGLEMQWGGHLRAIGTVTWIDDQSIYQFADTGEYYDGQAELRLKNEVFVGSQWSLETHYEAVALGGDTRSNDRELERVLSGHWPGISASPAVINDDRRFLNLTHSLITDDEMVVYHRLDRLNVTYTPSWGSLRIGRQALTWGNGMVFNPMDLFNPFAPTTVQRDYKVGDDMILGQIGLGRHDAQVLFVPRRDTADGQFSDSQSSLAGKIHLGMDALEADIMAARHYDDQILAWGATGYLGDAAWRLNAVYTVPAQEFDRNDFLQAVANLDYAWQWGGRNVYGLLELYYNGLGSDDDYARALESAYIRDRFSRGDLFSLGRYYAAGLLQIELHPLLQNHWTFIANLEDPSGLVQSQLLWDATADLQVILGAQWHWGAGGTEYGGFDTSVAGRKVLIVPSDQIYLWLTYSF